jgi:hypothetical protein
MMFQCLLVTRATASKFITKYSQSLAISGLKSRISITAGKRSVACGRNVTRRVPTA